jgi:replicative DNA helicase
MLSESEECIPRVQKLLPASEFQGQAHRSIASAMYALHSEGVVVDPLTLIAKLEKHGVLQAVGGKDYISFLIDAVPTAANVMHHARLIKQDGDRRRTISYLVNAVDGLKSGKLNLRELAVEAQSVLCRWRWRRTGEGSAGSQSRTSRTYSAKWTVEPTGSRKDYFREFRPGITRSTA